MAIFRWQGISPRGEVLSGEMEAPTRDAVLVRLRSQRIQPIPDRIKERGKGLDRELTIPGFSDSIRPRDIVVFTRQLATMIDAGLPIVQCLDVLALQSPNKQLRNVVRGLKDQVESGSTFTDALRKHPKQFDELFTNMVAAGEVGGILDTILNRLATYMEKAMKLKAKIRGAMIYPGVVVSVAIVVTAILLIFVIPVFAELFEGAGKHLPLPTQIVMNLSTLTINYFPYLIVLAVAFGFAIRQIYKTENGQLAIDKMLLASPVFGDLIRKASVARFTRTLSTLVSSGVPILDALAITARTSGNKVVERAILSTRVSISEGRTISEPLAESKVFPPMVCTMISVGESTGALDSMLNKVAEFYEEEVDNAVANLTSLLEPFIIVFLGTVIGGLVVAMYMPIFQLGEAIQ